MIESHEEIIHALVRVLNAYENKTPLVSNQGQALDGFSALANFVQIAKKARELLKGDDHD
jgi:hypothetical protein